MSGKTALVTGASKGIGLELARQFARAGYDPILVARDRAELATAARDLSSQFPVRTSFLTKDLSLSSAPIEIRDELAQQGRSVTVLVNNAGVGLYGNFARLPLDRQLDMMRINMDSLVALTRLFLPDMIDRGNGGVLNVASTAAFQPGPLMAVYYATKAFVLSFSEALAEELGGTGPAVTVLCPGPTRSRFYERSEVDNTGLIRWRIMRIMEPRDVARAGYEGFVRRRRVVVPGFSNRVGALFAKVMPRGVTTKAIKLLNKSRRMPDRSGS